MELLIPLKRGLRKSWELLWLLIKIIVPVSILVAALEHWGVMDQIASFFSPVMAWCGLPGEAAVVLTLGYLVNYYAALGVIIGLSLSPAEITILAVMLGISHELPVETVVCTHTGLPVPVSLILRISVSLLAGVCLNLLWSGLGGIL